MYTRSGTPDPVLRRLNREIVRALKDPTVAEKLATVGATPTPSTPEEADVQVKAGIANVAKPFSSPKYRRINWAG
jgi:tripartite-type tricarboxylate transporter receptor subunit TctC